ncbi:DnaD domain protein [Chloroflexota bacterium]
MNNLPSTATIPAATSLTQPHPFSEEGFYRWEQASRDTIDVKRCYIDVAGDLVAGILLSQIIYWFLPANGMSRLKVEHDGMRWLAKKRTDWWAECRITPKQYDRAIGRLRGKGLVETVVFKFGGQPMSHISLKVSALVTSLHQESLREGTQICPKVKLEFPQRVNSITESTDRDIKPIIQDQVIQFFQENFGETTGYFESRLNELIHAYDPGLVLKALGKALEYGKGNLAYTAKILEDWQENGPSSKPISGHRGRRQQRRKPVGKGPKMSWGQFKGL